MILFIAAMVLTGALIMVSVVLFCSVIFDTKKKAQQPEKPEQSETDYERPNVYYSKDIQIVSEPNYLTPPYRYSECTMATVERLQDNTILFCFLLEGNSVSIRINNSLLPISFSTYHVTFIVEYLKNKNILK